MGGLVLDVLIEYLCRGIALMIRSIRSAKWPTTNAKVTGSERMSFACEVARISFSYTVAGILHEGKQAVPFWFRNSAEQYVRFREPGTTVVVRVNPEDPGKSFLLDRVLSPDTER